MKDNLKSTVSYKERKNFNDFLSESILLLSTRIQLLIKRSFEEELKSLKEHYYETPEKAILKYNTLMKSKAIKTLNSFENTWIDRLSKIHIKFINIPDDDKEFIEYLYHLLMTIFNTLESKILTLNKAELTVDFERDTEDLTLEALKKLTKDFIVFVEALREILSEPVVEEYVSYSGSDIKRLMTKKFEFSELTLDISLLESVNRTIIKGSFNEH